MRSELRLLPIILALLVFLIVFAGGILIGLGRSNDWSVSGYTLLASFIGALIATAVTHEILLRFTAPAHVVFFVGLIAGMWIGISRTNDFTNVFIGIGSYVAAVSAAAVTNSLLARESPDEDADS